MKDIASFVADQPAEEFPTYMHCLRLFNQRILSGDVSTVIRLIEESHSTNVGSCLVNEPDVKYSPAHTTGGDGADGTMVEEHAVGEFFSIFFDNL